MRKQIIAVAALVSVTVPARAEVTGKARVIDGDTILINERPIRFYGIDAPELA